MFIHLSIQLLLSALRAVYVSLDSDIVCASCVHILSTATYFDLKLLYCIHPSNMPKRMASMAVDKTDTVIKKQKIITLQTKYIIIKLEASKSVTALASKFSMRKSMISMIIKDKEKYYLKLKMLAPCNL